MTLDHLAGRARWLALVLLACVVVGALAGVLWEWVWTPPSGVAYEGRWLLDEQGLPADFSATGWYVVIALALGPLVGAAVAWRTRRDEVLTLLTLGLGSLLAGWVMLLVGHALGPDDPQRAAADAEDLTAIPGDLGADRSAFVAFPSGVLGGAMVVFVTTLAPRRVRSSHKA